jgi:uncharacterized protein with gpF-like domain
MQTNDGRKAQRRLISPTGRDKALKPVRPNEGLARRYRRRLSVLIDEMNNSISYWLTAQFKQTPPELAEAAEDESPANALDREMRKMARRWTRRFNESAPKLAEWFAESALTRSDSQLDAILREAGFSVRFHMTQAQNDAYRAVINENVGLIKSIAAEHLSDVQGLVMRSVQQGGNLFDLTKELKARYGLVHKRAALIAHDQNSKATAVLTRARHLELGVQKARWLHSSAGRHPRPGHVKASRERLVYDVAKGAFIDGEYIWPGQLINCRCVAVPIIEGYDDT